MSSNKILDEKDLKESYEKIWKDNDLKEEPSYYNWILDLLKVEKNQKLLDVACGGGYLLNESEKKNLESYGIEICKNAIFKAKKLNNNPEFVLTSSESIPFNNKSFDYITCLGSLEHFLNPEKSLEEMSRVLKDSGKICIVLPNIWFVPDVLSGWLTGEGISHGQESERFYSLKEAEELIEKNSIFKIEYTDKYNQPELKFSNNKYYSKLYKLLRNKIPLSGSYVFIFICTKRYLGAPSNIEIGNKDQERYLCKGWYDAENWPPKIRWTRKKASVYLNINGESKKLFIKTFINYPNIVDIKINNEFVKKFSFDKSSDWKLLEIDLPTLDTNTIKVSIEVENTWIPDKVIKNGDKRELGIAIEKIWIR